VSPLLASLTIDLDGLEHYHRIHGLPAPPGGPDPIYERASARFGELSAGLGVKGTLFCVGRNLAYEPAARAVERLARDGHEIANHSLSHDYRLSRLSPEPMRAEIEGGAEAVARVCGRRPVGFRAPGYTLSAPLLAALARAGYRYDASAFPALPYYLAKAAVLLGQRMKGRTSAAILDRPRVLLAPRVPYRPHPREPYRVGALELLELPVATGLFGFPLTGAAVGALPRRLIRTLARPFSNRPLLDLELHGLDLLDASEVPGALRALQPELRVPLKERLARLRDFVDEARERAWVPLSEAAERLRATARQAPG